MRAVKFSLGEHQFESRNIREVQCLKDLGFQVTVYSKGDEDKTFVEEDICYLFEPTEKKYSNKLLNHALSAKKRLITLRGLDCDVLSCHDIHALLIGWLSTIGKREKPLLVYDAHELEVARNVGGGTRNGLSNAIIARLERFLMRRSAFTIAVNDSIADEMVRIHALPESMRPVVVRSTPSYWEYDSEAVSRNRELFCSKLAIDPNEAFIAMYHGGLMPDRGIEQAIEAVSMTDDVYLVIMGNGDSSYVAGLRERVASCGIPDRVLFFPAVNRDVLESHVAAADVGLVLLQNVTKNHYFTLPNKFFENIQAEVPLIASRYPELSRIVDEYEIGMTVDPHDIDQIVECICAMRDDARLRESYKANLRKAKDELCWEKERLVLQEAYRKLTG